MFWKHQQACTLTWGRKCLQMDVGVKGEESVDLFSLFPVWVKSQLLLYFVLTSPLSGQGQIRFYLEETAAKPETAKLWKGTIWGNSFSCYLYLKWSRHENVRGKSKCGKFGGRDDRVNLQYILIQARCELAGVTQVEWGWMSTQAAH